MKLCENCNSEHDGSYGSGRFCTGTCARGFSTKAKREDINKRVSETLSAKLNNGLTKQQIIQQKVAHKHAAFILKKELSSLSELSVRTVTKILKRMQLPCSLCGWYVEGVVGDIHHIIEKKNGGSNDHSNLTYICPNCHRMVHSNKIDSNKLVNLDDYIGDTWKDYYFIKKI